VIYEHRPASLPAERLVSVLKPVLLDTGKGLGSPFERDAAYVLRRVEDAVREIRAIDQTNRRAFLDLLARVIKTPSDSQTETPASPEPRIILP
jgi:hypothetical protein